MQKNIRKIFNECVVFVLYNRRNKPSQEEALDEEGENKVLKGEPGPKPQQITTGKKLDRKGHSIYVLELTSP